ncbi:MAG: prepilin-type N-terminal cleavage/methylation domain-containing protein [Armatimonadetes bacterium]|nr:prepilin-type N-terminal cleavage/methylation domain-containing protein [Armatimonadota bacterium]
MRRIRSSSGFSLVELLTVIAIIAILAGIIFPVMTAVKKKSKTTQCMTNLHNISMALKMFKQDNRRFPSSLAGYVQTDGAVVIPFERTRGDALYPEYVTAVKGFHCPLSPTTDTSATASLAGYNYYAYDSYDVYTPGVGTGGTPLTANVEDLRYTLTWADDATSLPLPPYPPGTPSTPDLDKYDYKRQLKFRSPSDDTVVTWCSYHEGGDSRAKIPVLFLDGHCDTLSADTVAVCRWRVQPNR